ncbi:hypothetical protein LCGC14_0016380 [marine sediment metagenome]|uniref:IrrE N-terminal-like domain-containing protein n=1 Tax=marine sediment metagenome TaxID=412755 RepID=A0A0F9YG38_9ZZZZ
MEIIRRHLGHLTREVEPRWPYTMPSMRQYGPEEAGRMLRLFWDVPSGPISSMTRLIEDAGSFVVPFDFRTDKIDAVSVEADTFFIFFVNPKAPADRLRFSLAHELGHLIYRHYLEPDDVGKFDPEKEANAFASAFLMPKDEIRREFYGEITIARLKALKERWLVSMAALIMRAHDVKAITQKRKQQLFMRMSQLGIRRKEPVEIPREQAKLYRRVLDAFQEELNYSELELCEILHMGSVKEFRTVYYPDRLSHVVDFPDTAFRSSL